MIEIISPEGWTRPRGYSNAVIGSGRIVNVAGQFGQLPEEASVSPGRAFGEQWAIALKRVADLVVAAGGSVTDIVKLNVYVTSLSDYQSSLEAVASAYSTVLGRHFPAITMVEVSRLLDGHATIEIDGQAIIG